MRRLAIYGGKPLKGELTVQGSKNAALPILAATLLSAEPCRVCNCPDLTDVHTAFQILEGLGARVDYNGFEAQISSANIRTPEICDALMCKMRSSVFFLGAMLSRFGKAKIGYPGGCALGARPIDLHIKAMEQLGVTFQEEAGTITATLSRFRQGTVRLAFPSVGATENLLLLCAISKGETVILNPAKEPEIVDLQNFLNGMGAKIQGAGSDVIRIQGVHKLHGCSYRVMPDRVVAATYASATVACGGETLLRQTNPEHLTSFLEVLKRTGAEVDAQKAQLRIVMKERPYSVGMVKTLPYPRFPTDMQPLLMAALLQAKGTTVFYETIFENRLRHVADFQRMGADIAADGQIATVTGVGQLHGAKVRASDLRGGAALAIAGLSACGYTEIGDIGHIERGYVHLEEQLRLLGGDVALIED